MALPQSLLKLRTCCYLSQMSSLYAVYIDAVIYSAMIQLQQIYV